MSELKPLKPWYQVVTPREDLRENRPLDASEFAVHLDHIREKRAHADYVEPKRFFERTYMTRSLLDLSSQVVRRLSGIQVETSAVFNMATQFGGGKTHSLSTLYHLAKAGKEARAWKGVDSILLRADVREIPRADVAVFVGTEFDVVDGRGGDGEPRRKTPWGEIAWQLGGETLFAAVANHDERGIAPAGDTLRRMLPEGPTLILVDELLNYVSRSRKTGLGAQLYNFIQALSEEARARNNLALCVSIPASEIEMNPEDQRDYDAHKKLLDRVGKAISMSSETEVNEIIRRRLFDWGGLPAAGKETARAYAEWARDHASDSAGLGGEASMHFLNPAIHSILRSSLSLSANGRACPASSVPAVF
jgi:predicted AAA+ superfamily ATPase